MSKIEDLDKLDRAIKDSEIRLKSIQSRVEQIDKEIAVLDPRQKELERNIEFHKKSDTIPIVQEHRKAKAELSKIKARLILIKADKKRDSQAIEDVKEIIDKFKRDRADLIKTSENNILKPNFGQKNG